MFGNMGKRSPSNLNWLLDKLNHSNAISPVSSINGNVCNKFSCINSHCNDARPLNMPDGMVSSRFRHKNNCSKCCCERKSRGGNADMLFSPKSLQWHGEYKINKSLRPVQLPIRHLNSISRTKWQPRHLTCTACVPAVFIDSLLVNLYMFTRYLLRVVLMYGIKVEKFSRNFDIGGITRVTKYSIKLHSIQSECLYFSGMNEWTVSLSCSTEWLPRPHKNKTYSLCVKFKPFNDSSVNWMLFPSR